jgi:hypothetical protein
MSAVHVPVVPVPMVAVLVEAAPTVSANTSAVLAVTPY